MFADILLPVPFESFTYAVPLEMEGLLAVGSRVVVQLGKNKKYAGIVLRLHNSEPQGVVIKPILDILDSAPIVTPQQIAFWQWISNYYLCPLGDVYKAAFPGGMKKEEKKRSSRPTPQPLPAREGSSYSFEGKRPFSFNEKCSFSPAQQQAYEAILASWGITSNDSLLSQEAKAFSLQEARKQASSPSVCSAVSPPKAITLLHGVTSSGKTEIYIHLIQRFLNEGKQVLYLLPEIALTTQITERLRKVFGDYLSVYHSKFSDRERINVYMKTLQLPQESPSSTQQDAAAQHPLFTPQLILGVRSSIFLPFQNLGLVIIDEEHEPSYKQQEPAPRYHARSAAIMLARQHGAKTLLGTATPSLETYHLAQTGRYGYVSLNQRYADIALPDIEVVDIARLRFQKRMNGAFSPRLIEAINEALSLGEQVILFQNRRGYSPFVECKQCGWVPRCQHCDVSLTFHKRTGQMICHYCGSVYEMPQQCPCCETSDFINKGSGTERIEEQTARLFPNARISRMDLDTAKTRGQYQQIIDTFAQHESDILIGTQMVGKGLDFDSVSVVGILDADTMLNQPDFRSYERTYHLLAQVAGRAGRKGHRGTVILQTRSAQSPIIQHVVENDYDALYNEQMEERQLFRYPPFTRLVFIYLRHRDNDVLQHLADEFATLLRQTFAHRVLGPDTPPVGRVASLHIRKLILKMEPNASVTTVRQLLTSLTHQFLSRPYTTNLNIYFDVDPM